MTVAPKQTVRVIVGGEELAVRSEAAPEYTREVASYFDNALRQIRAMSPTLEAHKAAILAGLAVTDQLFRARRGDQELATRITALAEDMARLLPPAKRGTKVSSAD